MAKKNNQNGFTDHHVIPQARGGPNTEENIKRVRRIQHEAFNTLFNSGNVLPEEAVMILINDWWYVDYRQRNKKLHELVMKLAKLCSDYVDKE